MSINRPRFASAPGRVAMAPAGTRVPEGGLPSDTGEWVNFGAVSDDGVPTPTVTPARSPIRPRNAESMTVTLRGYDALALIAALSGAAAVLVWEGELIPVPRPGPPLLAQRFRRADRLRNGDKVTGLLPVTATVISTTPLNAKDLAVFASYPNGTTAMPLPRGAFVTLATPAGFTYAPPSNFARRWAHNLIEALPAMGRYLLLHTRHTIPDWWPIHEPPTWPEHAPTTRERDRLQEAGLTP